MKLSRRLFLIFVSCCFCVFLTGCSDAIQNEKNKAEQSKRQILESINQNEISRFQKIPFEKLISSNDGTRMVIVFENDQEKTTKFVYSYLKHERYVFKGYYSQDKKTIKPYIFHK